MSSILTIHMDGMEILMLSDEVRDSHSGKPVHSEKITINLGAVDLGKVDLLVKEGLYSNRTDFIRTAIRSQIDKHNFEIQQSIARNAFLVGVLHYDRRHLERLQAKGERVRITVIGMLTLTRDIAPELAAEVIESVRVHGVFHASEAVKAALADRIV
jgi:Arc/MetJ-type ribon-helix-helix transcriptional regulator